MPRGVKKLTTSGLNLTGDTQSHAQFVKPDVTQSKAQFMTSKGRGHAELRSARDIPMQRTQSNAQFVPLHPREYLEGHLASHADTPTIVTPTGLSKTPSAAAA